VAKKPKPKQVFKELNPKEVKVIVAFYFFKHIGLYVLRKNKANPLTIFNFVKTIFET